VLIADVSEHYRFHLQRQVDEVYFIDLPLKMVPIECSETSAISTQTLGIHPKENILHLTHGENLKSRIVKNLFVGIKPLHVSVFFHDHLQGSSAVLCSVTIPPAQFTCRSPTGKNTKHTQMTYTCGHILFNNTDSTNANQREE
jgi:hypothetical protein